jgi:hypothetical protein
MNHDYLTSNDHLTVGQMEALLCNPETPERPQHLQECGTCFAELESMRATITDLRAALIASSEQHRRLAVMPAPAQRTPRALWSLVAATALLCVAGPIALHHKPTHVSILQSRAHSVPAAVSDEQLMSDIQQDLSSSVPQGMVPLMAKDATIESTQSTSSAKENE